MATGKKFELPSPPTFSQMMEDLETMSSDEKVLKPLQLELLAEQNETTNESTVDRAYCHINGILARLEVLQGLDASLNTQNDPTNDQLEKKLKDIIEQLQTCLTKLQTNSFSNTKNSVSDNRK